MFRVTDTVVVGIYELAKAHTSSCAHQRYIPFTQSPVTAGFLPDDAFGAADIAKDHDAANTADSVVAEHRYHPFGSA